MINLRKTLLLLFFLSFCFMIMELRAQSKDSVRQSSERVFNIQNCVNEFNSEETVGTEVGYQYWFVDKEFLDGRTLKMSVVGPIRQHTQLTAIMRMNSFLFLMASLNSILTGKPKLQDL